MFAAVFRVVDCRPIAESKDIIPYRYSNCKEGSKEEEKERGRMPQLQTLTGRTPRYLDHKKGQYPID
jgi:hypothetical protein